MTFVGVPSNPRSGLETRLTKALGSYVRNAYVEEVVETETGAKFASVGAVRPLFIFDDEKGNGRLHWQMASKFAVYKLTSRSEQLGFDLENLSKSEGPLRRAFSEDFLKTESAMLKSIEDYLVRIDLVRNSMTPIAKLVAHVGEVGSVRPEDLNHRKGATKAREYCEFLVSLDILRRENGHYVEGKRFNSGDIGVMSSEDLYEKVLGEVYRRGYSYMRTKLHLTGVVPYLNLSHAYYRPSYDYGEIVPLSTKQLWYWFGNFYGKVPPPATQSYRVMTASRAGLIERSGKDNLIRGKIDIFERFEEALT